MALLWLAALLRAQSTAAQPADPTPRIAEELRFSHARPDNLGRLPYHPFDPGGPTRDPIPDRLEWRPGEVVPPGYSPIYKPGIGLLAGGLATAGTAYSATVLVAGVAASRGQAEPFAVLFLPVIGPLVAIESTRADPAGAFLLVFDTVAQTAGLTLFALSFYVRDYGLVRDPPERFEPAPRIGFDVRPTMAAVKVEL
jgi:hypothetical protein